MDTDALLIEQPTSGEDALNLCVHAASSGSLGLIVVDSVAALAPRAELEGAVGDSHVGLQARMMSQAMRKVVAAAKKSGTTIMFLNQIRMKIGVRFGSPETTSGGRALRFYASIRLDVRRSTQEKDGQTVVGNEVRIQTKKNKTAPPFRKETLQIVYETDEKGKAVRGGLNRMAELVDLALETGALEKSGSWYSCPDENGEMQTLAQGKKAVEAKLLEDPALLHMIEARVLEGAGLEGSEEG